VQKFNEIVFFAGSRRDLVPATLNIQTFNSATPDVFAVDLLIPDGSAVTITNFLRGADAQLLRILGDGIVVVDNNATIKTNTGFFKTLNANVIYSFTYYAGVWYEAAV
jgi:hypothetical protein